MGSLAKGFFFRKVCGDSVENSRKFKEKRFITSGKLSRVRKFCGEFAEISQKFVENLRKMFCNDPFPNNPISELLTLWP